MSRFLKSLILIIIFLVGVALIALPFVFNMFDDATVLDGNEPWVFVALGAVLVFLMLLRFLLWLPRNKSKVEEPAKPTAPTPPTTPTV